MIADGPVDAIWIEDLNVKMMFEVETLVNASPATVSRAGIIFVSDSDLDWAPVMESWVRKRGDRNWHSILRQLSSK
jgi:dynein heavy chain